MGAVFEHRMTRVGTPSFESRDSESPSLHNLVFVHAAVVRSLPSTTAASTAVMLLVGAEPEDAAGEVIRLERLVIPESAAVHSRAASDHVWSPNRSSRSRRTAAVATSLSLLK